MRSYSIFTIFLLCIAILIIDTLAFYWLQSITQLLESNLKTIINFLFWIFTIGLISAILILKIKLDDIDPRRKQLLISSLYGLTVSSFIPKIIFVIVISQLFYLNVIFSEKESLVVVPIIGLFSGFLPFFAIVYAIFKSIYHFKIHRHTLEFEQLPPSFSGLKMVHISDLHLGSFNYRFKIMNRAIKLINDLEPDLIFFTGDLVNNYAWELRGWQRVFIKLKANLGKYAVLGNHDYGDYSKWETESEKQDNHKAIKRFYEVIDFKLLLNDSDIIKKGHEEIAIVGVENWGHPPFKQYGDLQKALEKAINVPFKILLSHDPNLWNEAVINKTDIGLTLSGHTHGMQAAIKIKGLQWSPIKYKYRHWAGVYQVNDQYLNVNRGLGWMGFPGRLGMRPEITSLKLISHN
ncbi:metallophosphoesterase [Confluentibacter lentus]|uniref:metallophosphoesterase n=1 Tax=Confluentibacter lentus TaxID=1699412 RepID=UPI000C28ACE2|nr:metallophosphoesterase [Confluentibacter lentus]